jgi:ABC-2 type transport system ATP-binding protein
LQSRFKRIELTLNDGAAALPGLPESWYSPEQRGRTIQFIDSQYNEQNGEEKIRSIFPNCQGIEVLGMSLREIFIALAKKFRLSEL